MDLPHYLNVILELPDNTPTKTTLHYAILVLRNYLFTGLAFTDRMNRDENMATIPKRLPLFKFLVDHRDMLYQVDPMLCRYVFTMLSFIYENKLTGKIQHPAMFVYVPIAKHNELIKMDNKTFMETISAMSKNSPTMDADQLELMRLTWAMQSPFAVQRKNTENFFTDTQVLTMRGLFFGI